MNNIVDYAGDMLEFFAKAGDWIFNTKVFEIPNVGTVTPIWLIGGVGILAILSFKVVRLVVG